LGGFVRAPQVSGALGSLGKGDMNQGERTLSRESFAPGHLGLIFITTVILLEPVIAVLAGIGWPIRFQVVRAVVHIVAAAGLTWALWMGVSSFRIICVVSLSLAGAYYILNVLVTPLPVDFVNSAYATLALAASGTLLSSRRVKEYLHHRDAMRLGVSVRQ